MTPLVDMVAVSEESLSGEAIELTVQTGYSRLPVYRERIDNIVGRIEARDLLAAPRDDIPVAQLMRPVHFVPESKRIDELFREMRDEADPMRIVVDEYGGSVGVVTLEDLLEEILGDIEDERDHAAPGIRATAPDEWRVPARTELEELEEAIGHSLPPGDYETVAGLLLAALGRIPEPGEKVRVGRHVFYIEAASERAIEMVKVRTT
jgi:CBS domain containing-hemolysin-like protein